MKYAVFLDVDGVFTSTRVHYAADSKGLLWRKFDPIAVEFMNLIDSKFDDVAFVLSSTWRDHLDTENRHILLWIESAFANAGFKGRLAYPHWKVNPENDIEMWTKRRAVEIKHYLEVLHPEIQDYIIFDDSDYNFNEVLGKKRFVKTDPDNGILWKHMKDAMSIMGTWDPKVG